MTPQGLPVMVSVHPMHEFQLLRKELKGRRGGGRRWGGATSWNCLLLYCRGHLNGGLCSGVWGLRCPRLAFYSDHRLW